MGSFHPAFEPSPHIALANKVDKTKEKSILSGRTRSPTKPTNRPKMLSKLTRTASRPMYNFVKSNSKNHNYKQLFTKAEYDSFINSPSTRRANLKPNDLHYFGAVPALFLFLVSGGMICGFGPDRFWGHVNSHVHDGLRAAESGKW